MRNAIILPWLAVENANAVAGLTWGFPAITHFMGYVHALSRKLEVSHGLRLEGCGVICHRYQLHAYSSGRDYQFALTRNPLTRDGKTASFNEEGRMHLTVSLIVECQGEIANGDIGMSDLAHYLQTLCQTQKLAGGTITSLRAVQVCALSQIKSKLFGLMPGFVLHDRSSWLDEHFAKLKQQDPESEMLDAWLDFVALKTAAEHDGHAEDDVNWHYQPKPKPGFLVPLMIGWQRISPLYEPGTVLHTRDSEIPFSFAEAVYGIGEWRGVHRIKNIDELLWRYHTTESGYYCRNHDLSDNDDNQENYFDTF